MGNHGALDPTAIAPLAAVDVLNSTINTRVDYMYFTQAIYRLNIMFRHMPVPRDTLFPSVIVCCESVGNCQTLSKDGPSQPVNSIIFRPFFCSLRPMSIVSYQFCPVPTCAHHVFSTLFSCLSIDSSLYHVIFSDM